MQWKWILLLSLFGVVSGLLAVGGVIAPDESWLRMAIWIITAVVLALKAPKQHFVHGAITGFLGVVLQSALQLLFFETLTANNPDIERSAAHLTEGWSIKGFYAALTPVVAIFTAVFLGLITLLVGKIVKTIRERKAEKPTTPVQ